MRFDALGSYQDALDAAQTLGVWPFLAFIAATLLVLAKVKRVFPALGIGIAAGLVTFIIQTPGGTT